MLAEIAEGGSMKWPIVVAAMMATFVSAQAAIPGVCPWNGKNYKTNDACITKCKGEWCDIQTCQASGEWKPAGQCWIKDFCPEKC